MKQGSVYVLVLFSFILALASTLIYLPSNTPYSPWNNGGNGLSSLLGSGFKPVIKAGPVDCNKTIIVLMNGFLSTSEINNLSYLAICGSRIILLDRNGYSIPILDKLGIRVVFTEHQVMDQIYNTGERWIPVGYVNTSIPLRIAVPNATYIDAKTKPDFLEARTSRFAYVDLDDNGYFSTQDKMGSYIIAAGWRTGRGEVILIPSTLFTVNKYIGEVNNRVFLAWLSNGTTGELYLPSIEPARVDIVKYYLYIWTYEKSASLTLVLSLTAGVVLTYLWGLQYIDRSHRNRRVIIFALLLSAIPFLVESFLSGNYLLLTPLAIALSTIPLDLLPATSFMVSMAMASFVLSPWYMMIYLVILAPLALIVRKSEGQGLIGPRMIALLVLQATLSLIAFIYPPIIAPLAIASIAMIVASIAVYTTLTRHVRVEPIKNKVEAYIGSPISLGLAVETRGPVIVKVKGDGLENERKMGSTGLMDVEYTPKHTGNHTLRLNTYVTDKWGVTWRVLEPFNIRVNVLPQAYKMLTRAGALLAGPGPGDLLSKLSVTLIVHKEELEGQVEVVSGEELAVLAAGEGGERGGEGRGGPSIISRIVKEYFEGLGGLKARLGEYIGVREYIPTDDPRNIHWKKSLGILKLVSKEYVTPMEQEAGTPLGGRGGLFVLASLDCTWSVELDYVLTRILSILVGQATRNPEARFTLILYTRGKTLVLDGPVKAVLELLYKALRDNPLELKYEYRSLNTYMSPEEIKYMANGNHEPPFEALLSSFLADSRIILEALRKTGLKPPMDFTVIHCKPLSTRASFIVYSLSRAGYRYQKEVAPA